jgi:hypothetical protein
MATKKVATKVEKKKPAKTGSKTAVKSSKAGVKPASKAGSKSKSPVKAKDKKVLTGTAAVPKKDAPTAKPKAASEGKPTDDKAIALKVSATGSTKSTEKKATTKGGGSKLKNKKTESKEDDFDADLESEGFGDSEIAEYEDDLKAVEEIDDIDINDLDTDEDSDDRDQEVYLTDSEGRRLCRVRDCDQVATVDGYCRYHYLLLWKKIQIRKSILLDGKLEKYVMDLTSRYPDKYLEAIRKDLRSEKDFLSAIQELEIDESALGELENQEDEQQSFSDEFRGISEAPSVDEDGDY